MTKPLCVVAGVGPGNGLACAQRFTTAGYQTAILARDANRLAGYAEAHDDMHAFGCDLARPDSITATFKDIQSELGVPDVVIYNAGSGMFGPALDTPLEDFEIAWRINALGLLAVAQAATPAMIENGGGCLLVTGATASLRGGANFAAFSSAKGAQRNLTQSLARSLGSRGIHVALVVIDGVIDIPRTREMMPDKPDEFFLQPGAIAEVFYQLSQQDKSAWTFEIDVRPSGENW